MRNKRIKIMVEIGLVIALSVILGQIRLFRMPYGGSVSLEMLPIFIIAFRRGGVVGIISGLLYGIVQLIFDPYIVHPAQLILDYPLAYALVGLAGFIPLRRNNEKKKLLYLNIIVGVLLGSSFRFFAHVLSGIIFFAENIPVGQSALMYSIIYNVQYILPAVIISIILLLPLIKSLIIANRPD